MNDKKEIRSIRYVQKMGKTIDSVGTIVLSALEDGSAEVSLDWDMIKKKKKLSPEELSSFVSFLEKDCHFADDLLSQRVYQQHGPFASIDEEAYFEILYQDFTYVAYVLSGLKPDPNLIRAQEGFQKLFQESKCA